MIRRYCGWQRKFCRCKCRNKEFISKAEYDKLIQSDKPEKLCIHKWETKYANKERWVCDECGEEHCWEREKRKKEMKP